MQDVVEVDEVERTKDGKGVKDDAIINFQSFHLQIKGLTLLWMCLCCLRPDEVAKVLPHSGHV